MSIHRRRKTMTPPLTSAPHEMPPVDAPRRYLDLTHTDEAGTTLAGTERGDQVYDVLHALGWRWGRALGRWYVPRSRYSPPRRDLIEATAAELRAAGHAVTVLVDATPADRGDEDRLVAERADARATRLSARAEREWEAGAARRAASKRIAEGYTFGQPVLAGHHSQARHEADAARARGHMLAAISHYDAAQTAERAAVAAAATGALRHSPHVVARRIEQLTASTRKQRRVLDGMRRACTTPPLPVDLDRIQQYEDRLAHDLADLEHWQQVRAQQLASGTALDLGPDTVAAGDRVRIAGSWYPVLRANARSVRVETPTGPRTTSWTHVREHQPQDAQEQP